MQDRFAQWIEEGWETDDLVAAGDLAKVYAEHGDASPEWTGKVRLLLSEYEPPKIFSALVMLLSATPSMIEVGNQAFSAEIDRQVTQWVGLNPSERTPDKVMAYVDTMEI